MLDSRSEVDASEPAAPQTHPFQGSTSSRLLLLVMLGAMAVRALAIMLQMESLEQDPDSYRWLSETWAQTGTFGFGDIEAAGEGTNPRPT
ncbi:MAG: hypothetical protein AAF483_21925, partial [Planctomycetota bacterium]